MCLFVAFWLDVGEPFAFCVQLSAAGTSVRSVFMRVSGDRVLAEDEKREF